MPTDDPLSIPHVHGEGIIRFSVQQIVLVNLLFVGILVAGIFALHLLPVDVYPDINLDEVTITTFWVGASATEIERLVSKPIEEELATVLGIDHIVSNSQQDVSLIQVKFDETLRESEYQAAVEDVHAAVRRARNLPKEIEQPVIRKLTVSEAYPFVNIAVADRAGLGRGVIREVTRDLKERLEQIPDIIKVRDDSVRRREVHILADRAALRAHDLSLPDLAEILRQSNRTIPGGVLERGAEELTLRVRDDVDRPEQLNGIVIKKHAGGSQVYLRDVARVEIGFERNRVEAWFNGALCYTLALAKHRNADSRNLVRRVDEFLQQYRRTLPPGIEVDLVNDTTQIIDSRLDMLLSNLLQGSLLVFGVLWMTLGLRNALLAVVDIPFCFLTAFLLLWWQGVSINALSLFALVFVNGIMVDDAIVMIENIYHHIQRGVPLRRAVIDGAREVMWPVICSTTTTILAFLPMFLMEGVVGKFFSVIPTVVCCTLVASLIDTLLILPAHYYDFGTRQRRVTGRWSEQAAQWSDAFGSRLTRAYLTILRAVLAHRVVFLSLVLATGVFCAGLSLGIPVNLFPSDFQMYFLTIETTPNCSVSETSDVLHQFEQILETDKGRTVQEYLSLAGFAMSADGVFMMRPNLAQSYVNLEQNDATGSDPTRAVTLMTRRITEALVRAPITNLASWSIDTPRDGPPVGKPVAIRIQGPDYAIAKRIAIEFENALKAIPGVSSVADNFLFGQPQVTIEVDESRTSIYGLTFLDVATALQGVNEGLVVGSFKDERLDEDVDIRLRYLAENRANLADVLDSDVKAPSGVIVKMRDLTRSKLAYGAPNLYHYDTQRTVLVTADVDTLATTSVAVNTAIQALFADVEQRYPGYRVSYGGEFEETRNSFASLRMAYVLALLLIYGNLAAEFRSYWQPLLIMVTIPFSFVAAVTGLLVLQLPFTVTTFIAMTGLAGVVVNDSIVLMDMVNKRRRAGDSPREAVLAAGGRRLRPVLLTVITTVLGLLPTALGFSGSNLVWAPFAISFTWGLSFDTLLTLLLVPVLYTLIEDARLRWRGGEPADASSEDD